MMILIVHSTMYCIVQSGKPIARQRDQVVRVALSSSHR